MFAEVDNWYINEWWSENARNDGGEAIADFNTGVWMDRIGAVEAYTGIPGLPDQGPNEGFGLREHLEAARAQGNALFHFVSYDLPGRDCAAEASNGELPASAEGMAIYREHYVDRIYNILKDYPDIPVAVIIEIDSLPNLVTNYKTDKCIEVDNTKSWGYVNGVRYSINKYSQLDNVHIYVDAGHSGWLGWDDDINLASLFLYGTIAGFDGLEQEAQSIVSAGDEFTTAKYGDVPPIFVEPPSAGPGDEPPGFENIDGFITNVANYTPLEEPYLGEPDSGDPAAPLRSAVFYDWNPRFGELQYTEDWLDALRSHGADVSHLGMLIDTGRNGWGGPNRPSDPGTRITDPAQVDDYRIDRREHRGNWCNQYGGVGERPQANPQPWIDAYVWTKPQGESDGIAYGEDDPRWVVDPNDTNKRHDAMCDPEALSQFAEDADSTADLDLGTSAMPNAPHAGRWFSEGFREYIKNAYPPL